MSQTSRAEHFFYNSINCVNEVLFLFVSSSRANSRCRGVRVLNIFNVSLVFFLSFDFHGFFPACNSGWKHCNLPNWHVYPLQSSFSTNWIHLTCFWAIWLLNEFLFIFEEFSPAKSSTFYIRKDLTKKSLLSESSGKWLTTSRSTVIKLCYFIIVATAEILNVITLNYI